MSIKIIAAVGRNGEIGKAGGLVFNLPGDLKWFKRQTAGKAVLMGLKTWESLPRKLPGREHFVLAREGEAVPPKEEERVIEYGGQTSDEVKSEANDIVKVVRDVVKFKKDWRGKELFVIGGGMIYQEMLADADELFLTEVEAEDAKATVFFPKFDRTEWRAEKLGEGKDNGISYSFMKYTRKEKK